MTISDDELARLESRAKAGLLGTRQDDADAIAAVAEVRECWVHARRQGERLGEAWQAHDGVCAERDALRAENERLREELAEEKRRLLADDERRLRIRAHLAVEREAAELRASLADAVGKIARMEPVVVTACSIAEDAEHRGKSMANVEALKDVVRVYEASLPGLVPM